LNTITYKNRGYPHLLSLHSLIIKSNLVYMSVHPDPKGLHQTLSSPPDSLYDLAQVLFFAISVNWENNTSYLTGVLSG